MNKINIKIRHTLSLLGMIPLQVLSEEDKSLQSFKTETMSGGYLLQLIFGLVIVIICIVALSWLAKRMHKLQSSSEGSLKIIDGINMSARERVVLLQAGNKQILVGVAPGRVDTIHVFDEPIVDIDTDSTSSTTGSFSEKLSTMISSSLKNKVAPNNENGQGRR